MSQASLLRSIRIWLGVVIVGLVVSGVTAFPLQHELEWMVHVAASMRLAEHLPTLNAWLTRVLGALTVTDARYPFLAYGTDWLAFAHLVLAVAFVGPWRDPVRNKWVLQFGLIACAAVVPLALIAGAARGIPLWWRLGDCCFGVCGTIPLWFALRDVKVLEADAILQT